MSIFELLTALGVILAIIPLILGSTEDEVLERLVPAPRTLFLIAAGLVLSAVILYAQ